MRWRLSEPAIAAAASMRILDEASDNPRANRSVPITRFQIARASAASKARFFANS